MEKSSGQGASQSQEVQSLGQIDGSPSQQTSTDQKTGDEQSQTEQDGIDDNEHFEGEDDPEQTPEEQAQFEEATQQRMEQPS